MELFKAHNQWATRPEDERFWTLEEMRDACHGYYKTAVQARVAISDLRAEADDGNVYLVGKSNERAMLTNWAFGQLSQRAKAPAGYLRDLPATLAVQNINYGLKTRADDAEARLMFHRNGNMLLRAITGVDYARIWNYEVADRLCQLQGWKTPPARPMNCGSKVRKATMDDIKGLPTWIKEGDTIGPAGIYASDHDMFVFLIDTNHTLEVDGKAFYRGIIIWNSEVGAKSVGGMSFIFNAVCGNHIIWGAKHVTEFRFRHVGNARARAFRKMAVDFKAYADSSVNEEQAKLIAAKSFVLGDTKEEILDTLFKYSNKRKFQVGKPILEAAVERAEERVDRYGAPNTAWAVSNGLSEVSQETVGGFADKRFELDRVAGKIMEIAF